MPGVCCIARHFFPLVSIFLMIEALLATLVAALWPLGPTPAWALQQPAVAAPQPVALALAPAVPVPQLLSAAAAGVAAPSVVVLGADGTVLYSRSADEQRFIASLTKLATALVAADAYEPGTVLPVSRTAAATVGSGIGLAAGDAVPARDLLAALLVASANDAAATLAENYPGGTTAFIAAMNARAAQLGLRHTHFANVTGLDEPTHYGSVHDMATLLQTAQQHPQLQPLLAQQYVQLQAGSRTLQAQNTNKLLWSPALQVRAGKTGTTDGAGECLLVSTEIAGQAYTIGVVGSSQRFTDVRRIITSLQGHLQPAAASAADTPVPVLADAPADKATGGG